MNQEQSRPSTPSEDSNNENNEPEVYTRYIPRRNVKKIKLIPEQAATTNCSLCGQWAAHHELFGNPCCKTKLYCLECFLGEYRKPSGSKFLIPTLISCKNCLHIFPNPLAPDTDLESLIKINQVAVLPIRTTDQVWHYAK